MVNHLGQLGGGHYTATLRTKNSKVWFEFSDALIQQVINKTLFGLLVKTVERGWTLFFHPLEYVPAALVAALCRTDLQVCLTDLFSSCLKYCNNLYPRLMPLLNKMHCLTAPATHIYLCIEVRAFQVRSSLWLTAVMLGQCNNQA